MTGKDWKDLGNDLNRIIEDAIHMGNFVRLNRDIDDTIRKTFGSFDGQEFRKGDGWDFDLSGNTREKHRDDMGNEDHRQRREHMHEEASPAQPLRKKQETAEGLYAGRGRRKGGAIGILSGGIVLTAASIFPLMALLIGIVIGADKLTVSLTLIFAALTAAGILFIVKGVRSLKLSGRFEKYIKVLGEQTYGDIKTIAAYCHTSEKDIIRDLKKMLSKGWFLQGHLDQNETCLMVSNEAYRQYLETLHNAEIQREEMKKKAKREAEQKSELDPEVRAILDKGQEYIESIRRCNDAIPGEEVSNKMYRMELLVRRIFQQTEAHPENAKELRKLMDYYLPMTVKLLKAYEELDRQPVYGENIATSKKEIEDTIDTLNTAFEKMLDNLFQDTAWDVSSDISVLETMLAQEGLMEDGFKKQ